jgi:hypothetical protein
MPLEAEVFGYRFNDLLRSGDVARARVGPVGFIVETNPSDLYTPEGS